MACVFVHDIRKIMPRECVFSAFMDVSREKTNVKLIERER